MPQDSPLIDWRDDGLQITLPQIHLARSRTFWFGLIFTGFSLSFCVFGCVLSVREFDPAVRWFGAILANVAGLFTVIGLWTLAHLVHHARRPTLIVVDAQEVSIEGAMLRKRKEVWPRKSIRAVLADDWGLWLVDGGRPRSQLHLRGVSDLPPVAEALRRVLNVAGTWPCEPGEIPVKICYVDSDKPMPPRDALLLVQENLLKIRIPGRGFGIRLQGYIGRPPLLRAILQGFAPGDAIFAGIPFIKPEHCQWINTREFGRCLRIAPRGVNDGHILLWTDSITELETTMSTFWDRLRHEAQIKV